MKSDDLALTLARIEARPLFNLFVYRAVPTSEESAAHYGVYQSVRTILFLNVERYVNIHGLNS